MLQFQRPALDPAFVAKARPHATAVAAAVKNRQPIDWTARDAWKHAKPAFSEQQNAKCGYCEAKIAANQDGDVDHLAPKSEVWNLSADEREWGDEKHAALPALVPGSRKGRRVAQAGYWYLAYDWTNYVFACTVCNSKYKVAYYPLAPVPRGKTWKPSPTAARPPKPLLLNCFDHPAPWRHFIFDPVTGAIRGKSDEGRATIATCGLFRETLRQERLEAIRDALKHCRRIAQTDAAWAWADLADLGDARRAFAGAVRAVAETELGLEWDEIDAHAKHVAAATTPARGAP